MASTNSPTDTIDEMNPGKDISLAFLNPKPPRLTG
jgi:hypothetical protein